MSSTATVTTEPIAGFICPSCGHADGIIKVTRTIPPDSSDVICAAMFGWIFVLSSHLENRSVRLKCGRCHCQFHKPSRLMAKLGWWLLITATLMAAAFFLGNTGQAREIEGRRYDALVTTAAVLHGMSERPLLSLLLVGIPFLTLLGVFIIGHSARNSERAQTWKAVRRRPALPSEPLISDDGAERAIQ